MKDSVPETPWVSNSDSRLVQVDAICDRFEAAWQTGQRPGIEDALTAVPEAGRGDLLRELVLVELHWRKGKGEQPAAEEYHRRFPEYRCQIDAAFAHALASPPTESGNQVIDSTLTRRRALQIRCPRCRNPVEVVDDAPLAEIVCFSCGSKFSLAGDETADFGAGQSSPRKSKTVGHFELIEALGSGAFGTVWKARDTKLDRVVAVKIPRKGQLDRAEAEKFLREARTAAQLQHPHIVGVHEVGLEGDLVYIVSDFIAGLSLDKWLAGQKLTHCESAELCVKIAEALHYAHEHGIIHRDLKPSNIMIDRAGEPHLMDFGLAKREVGEVTMTVEGQILGTPAYMSPEQAKGEGHTADRRTDIYSLGVILFELLTGERPFRGDVRMLLIQVVEDEPPSLRRLDSRIPRDLETIVGKCLEKPPAKRYVSASELADDLGRYLRGEPTKARPVGRAERFWRWCRRYPAIAALAGATALLLVTVAAVASLGYAWVSAALKGETAALQREAEQHHLAQEREHEANRLAGDLLVNEVQRLRRDRPPGWTWLALDDIRKAMELRREGGDRAKLRALAASCFAGIDLRPLPLLEQGLRSYCLAFSPDGGRLAIVQHKARGIHYALRSVAGGPGYPSRSAFEFSARILFRGREGGPRWRPGSRLQPGWLLPCRRHAERLAVPLGPALQGAGAFRLVRPPR